MSTTYYSQDHEWISVAGDVATVGITTHAANALGDLVYVELPEAGRTVEKGEAVAVVESVKAASDVYAPLVGTVIESNAALSDDPGLANQDAEGEAWFFKLKLAEGVDLSGLLDRAGYDALVESQS